MHLSQGNAYLVNMNTNMDKKYIIGACLVLFLWDVKGHKNKNRVDVYNHH